MHCTANVNAQRKRNAGKEHQIEGLGYRSILPEQQLFEFLCPPQDAGHSRGNAQFHQKDDEQKLHSNRLQGTGDREQQI